MKKIAVITGGVRRLGGEISQYLLDNNYEVISLNSRNYSSNEYPIVSNDNFNSKIIDLKTATTSEFKNLVDQIPQIDLLINNASIFFEKDFFEVTEEDWNEIFSINLKSIFFLSQTVAKKMIAQENKSNIINIIDSGGDLLWTKYFVYNLTKNNLIHLTKLLAKKLSPNVRVNGIAPGTIIPEQNASQNWIDDAASRSVLKKIGDPSEVTRLIDVILNSNFMTGSILTVDGGRSLL